MSDVCVGVGGGTSVVCLDSQVGRQLPFIGAHEKCSLLLRDYDQNWNLQTLGKTKPNTKFHGNSFGVPQVVVSGWNFD